ncbi:hypothetical protein EUGRSUZ_A02937 [Eucalyptus grandis]|uniref:Uncharacterized protein n=2 Tax=Eucalyptus grandis TaxID=71139 RepID=A0ACC3M9G5_EUCGR|nr:hypothetical protein EUGRSUZ_A02937 [Eucalyptus grandis]
MLSPLQCKTTVLFINNISPTAECASSRSAPLNIPIITFDRQNKKSNPIDSLKNKSSKTLPDVLNMTNMKQETRVGTRIWDCTEIWRKIILEKSVQKLSLECRQSMWRHSTVAKINSSIHSSIREISNMTHKNHENTTFYR